MRLIRCLCGNSDWQFWWLRGAGGGVTRCSDEVVAPRYRIVASIELSTYIKHEYYHAAHGKLHDTAVLH